jgi:hypothetical protein
MKYRVTYPLITQDGHREFETREDAEVFARAMRNRLDASRYSTVNSWRLVSIQEIPA